LVIGLVSNLSWYDFNARISLLIWFDHESLFQIQSSVAEDIFLAVRKGDTAEMAELLTKASKYDLSYIHGPV
jgi:hypothetical protein